ncbi:MAG: hypothetical protein ACTSU5_04705 [Promethearchaeota archaeon]
MEIEKIQKWLFNFLKFQPKKDVEDIVEELVDDMNHVKHIAGTRKVEERRVEVEKIVGDAFLKILQLSNELQMDLVTILQTHFKLGV